MEKLKRGHVREDGMVLLRRRHGQDFYVTKERYESYLKSYKKHIDKRRQSYREVERKWKIGEINPETGLYFIRNNGAYRPIFGTLNDLEIYRNKVREKQKKYISCRKTFEKKWRRGDVDPVMSLYFWKYNYRDGKEIWLTKEKFNAQLDREKRYRSNKVFQK